MKAATRKIAVALLSVVFSATILGTAAANTYPYFKVYGGDVMTGGWFKTSSTCSTTPASTYQDPSYKAPPNVNQNGGILAYANDNGSQKPQGGASTEFAAYAIGLIEYNDVKNWGFYSGGALKGAGGLDTDYLSFANNNAAAPMGGLFEGAVRQSNCIPDYYTTQQHSPTSLAAGAAPDLSTAAGQYLLTPNSGALTLNGVGSPKVIQPGAQITVFVDGNVFIGDNITYSSSMNVTNIPKFTLIARGSIYISPNVTQLDGLYIAQPDAGYDSTKVVADDEGVIWTCHSVDPGPLADSYPSSSCNSRLVINGALIAKQINFMRTKGDVGSAPDPSSGSACLPPVTNEECLAGGLNSGNIAEIINFSPAMVMGGGFFNPSPLATPKVQSVISLPPVF